ncbi:hypothetical protein IQ225_16120 [Synechocystis salina LEGE 06155]|nr:hypothetical protein [Synechocystis salina LEGE 06155]
MAKSFVQKIIKQWRKTRNLSPHKPSGGQRLKLSQSHIIMVGDWVDETNELLLKKFNKDLKKKKTPRLVYPLFVVFFKA